jgi:hypothetical protein
VALAVRRNQRRLLALAVGIPALILVGWKVATWPRPGVAIVTEQEAAAQQSKRITAPRREAERQRRQRLLLRQGSFRLSSDQKAEVLTREMAVLLACLKGKASDGLVRFRIKPNGAPFDIRVAGVGTDARKCMRQLIAKWRFGRFTGPPDEMSFPIQNN